MENGKCGRLMILLVVILPSTYKVSGLECFDCSSLGVSDSHTDNACVTFDTSKIGTEPCQVSEGQVAKCQVFKGSVTVSFPLGNNKQYRRWLFLLFVVLPSTYKVSGLECFDCNSLGASDSHTDEACVTFDTSKIDTEPCQVSDGQVAKCQVFKGSVTVDFPFVDEQSAAGTYRACAVFDRGKVSEDGCYRAESIPNDILGTVFKVTSFLGAEEIIDGQTCYCSGDRCHNEPDTSVTVPGLECYSCNSLGVKDSHTDDVCVELDKSKIGTEPCQVPDGKVGKCQVFKGSVTADLPIFGERTASGSYRACAVFDRGAVPEDGCYRADEIPNDILGTAFKVTSFLGVEEAIDGTTCYCSGDRCVLSNDPGAGPGNGSASSLKCNLVNSALVALLYTILIWCM